MCMRKYTEPRYMRESKFRNQNTSFVRLYIGLQPAHGKYKFSLGPTPKKQRKQKILKESLCEKKNLGGDLMLNFFFL